MDNTEIIKKQQFDLDLVTQKSDIRDNPFSKVNQGSKFGNHQEKGHKISVDNTQDGAD